MIEFFIKNQELFRNWGLFIFALVGAWLAVRTFNINLRQRKLENTFKLLEFMRSHIDQIQVEKIISLFHANNPLAGHPEKFVFNDGSEEPVVYMFSEGGCGNGEVHNALEVFNLAADPLLSQSVSVDMVWYEYGQLMHITNDWLNYIDEHGEKAPTFKGKKVIYEKIQPWPTFQEFMKNKPDYGKPMKYYTYAE